MSSFAVAKAKEAAKTKLKKLKSLDDVEPLDFGKSKSSTKKKLKLKLKSLDDVVPLNLARKNTESKTSKPTTSVVATVSSNTTPVYKKAVPVVPALNVTSNAAHQNTTANGINSGTQATTNPSIQQAQPLPIAQQTQQVQSSLPVVNTVQMPVSDLRKQSSQGYYPGLPAEERVAKLLADGCTNEQIAMRLDMSLKAVGDLRKQVRTKTLIQSPRDLFSQRLGNFNEAFEVALSLFNDTPDSEISYKILVEFMKTMRELVKDYNELEDPRVLAQQIVGQILRPLVQSMLTVVVSSMRATIKNVSPFLKEQERVMLTDSLTNGLRTLQDSVNGEYNNSVGTLEKIFAVELDSMKVHAKSKDKMETPESSEPMSDIQQ